MQNLPVKPLGSDMPRLKKGKVTSGTAVEGETRTYDISATFTSEAILNQAMDGKVYLAVCGAHQNYGNKISSGEINTNETYAITISIPGITVNGTEGASTATKVNDFSDTVLMWDGTDNSYGVCTQTTSGTAKLLAVTYSGTTMVDAKVVPIDATTNTTGVISGTVPALTAGDSLKIYLWKGDTLVPITDVIGF